MLITEEEAVKILMLGDTVAVPTETVYGLAALATNPEAIAKIFHLYAELPATYGATAIAGTLRGRNVNKILKRRPEYAEFKDVPYNFLFTMAELMEKFIKATTSAKTKDADWQHWIQARDKASTQGACYIYEKLALELLNEFK